MIVMTKIEIVKIVGIKCSIILVWSFLFLITLKTIEIKHIFYLET